eukprot:scaffold1394_cov109-Isochrysis_galbana.AAC.18
MPLPCTSVTHEHRQIVHRGPRVSAHQLEPLPQCVGEHLRQRAKLPKHNVVWEGEGVDPLADGELAVGVGDRLQLEDGVLVGRRVDDDEAQQDLLLGRATHPERRVAPRGRPAAVRDDDA